MRSGTVYLRHGFLRIASSDGVCWAATAGSSTRAYYLYFRTSIVYATSLDYKYGGFSARCLASGDWSSKIVRSGNIDLSIGYLRDTGSPGYYWNATSGGSTFAYSLGFNPSNVFPTILSNQYFGFSARCLASGDWFPKCAQRLR